MISQLGMRNAEFGISSEFGMRNAEVVRNRQRGTTE
jgi:hypothetical protein